MTVAATCSLRAILSVLPVFLVAVVTVIMTALFSKALGRTLREEAIPGEGPGCEAGCDEWPSLEGERKRTDDF